MFRGLCARWADTFSHSPRIVERPRRMRETPSPAVVHTLMMNLLVGLSENPIHKICEQPRLSRLGEETRDILNLFLINS
jgi:hypothetical protein